MLIVHRPFLARSAWAIPLAVALAVVAASGQGSATVAASNPAASAAPQSDLAMMCGTELPVRVAVPPGFSDAVSGVSPDTLAASGTGQLAVHWTTGESSVEVRWPADVGKSPLKVADRGFASMTRKDLQPAANGRVARAIVFRLGDQPRPECRSLQIEVFSASGETTNALTEQLRTRPFVSDKPIVVRSERVAGTPAVVRCQMPPGAAPAANQAREVAGSPSASPREALAAFVAGQPRLAQYGYAELQLPDGSVAYSYEAPSAGVVTVIHVSQRAAGWAADHMEASGC